jgi:amino acid permease
MSKELKEYALEDEDEGNVTSPEKAEDEEIRNFKEEPGDDDGENRHPTTHNSMIFTSLLILKAMIGAGILNLPLIIKTFGIIGGILLSIFLNFIAITVAYFLGRCKEITQRYSYAVYSKLTMGLFGTILIKFSLMVMLSTLAVVQFIVFGDVLKGLSLLAFDINVKLLILLIALIILPFIFQKEISGITKIAHFGIIGLGVFLVTTIVLFFDKFFKNKIFFEKSMLYPNGTFKELFTCVGGYYNAFGFHMVYFPYYLLLKPRNTKTMMKSVIIGIFLSTIIYDSYGIIFFLMYGNQINDSALKYLQNELSQAHKNNETFIVIILVICFLSFLVNASISTITNIFFTKSHLIGLIKFILKKRAEKKEPKDIPLMDINENRKFSDDVQSMPVKEKEDEFLSEKTKFIITFAIYIYILVMALTFEKIIVLDSFNGSVVSNYIYIMAPSIFYLYFARKKKYYGEKLLAVFNFLFGAGLISLFFILSFYKN